MANDNVDPFLTEDADQTDDAVSDTADYDEIIVDDAENDIAYTVHQKGMRIGLPGRILFQETYHWLGAPSTFSRKILAYDAATDVCETAQILPLQNELSRQGSADKAYMMVGILPGQTPAKYKNRNSLSNDADQMILPLDDYAMPVVIAIEDLIPETCHLFVCARETAGKRLVRRISIDKTGIFFFPEFWAGPMSAYQLTSKRREDAIRYNIRYHCARIKERRGDDVGDLTSGLPSEQYVKQRSLNSQLAYATSRPSSAEDYSPFDNSPSFGRSAPKIDAVDHNNTRRVEFNSEPDLQFEQMHFFFDYGKEMNLDAAEGLVEELKLLHPNLPDIDAKVVQKARNMVAADDGFKDCLAYEELPFFLSGCQMFLQDNMEQDGEAVNKIVGSCIALAFLHRDFSVERATFLQHGS